MSANVLPVVLMWHMHQPHYRDAETGEYQLPWTYLHAIKDYVDMVAYLEMQPKARVVVNFTPVLLEQIDDYARQLRAFIDNGVPISDPLLAALAAEQVDDDSETRLQIIKACLRANEKRLIQRYPAYDKLARMARWVLDNPEEVIYFDPQFFADLLVWYHLAWFAETERRKEPRLKALMKRRRCFSLQDRRLLLEMMAELLEQVIPRYRVLAEQGQIELSFSPYMHPILPLLEDFRSATEAMPQVSLPQTPAYPGGDERAHWHMQQGLDVFHRYFGFRPRGCWPSEGAVSADVVALCEQFQIEWLATGESVLRKSLEQAPELKQRLEGGCIHRSYRLGARRPRLFFRDDGLSDLIGFTYSDWHADDAVNNLLHHLENIADACDGADNRVVSIILDGENAWEYYPENAFYFLTGLYQKLVDHPRLRMVTFSDFLDQGKDSVSLEKLVAGSWVYGTFSTWIGDPDKNQAWDLLCEAKRVFDEQVARGRLKGKALEKATHQLGICEGSDWFWWFGDYNPAESVRDFERLYRTHLRKLYRLMGVEAPAVLDRVLSQGGGTPAVGGVMRRGQEGDG